MEWREISVTPENPTGVLQKKHGTFKKAYIVPAYTSENVMDFYRREKSKALEQNLCCSELFDAKNRDFFDALCFISWPAETLEALPSMLIPISNKQLLEEKEWAEFETLRPFLNLAMFETLTLEQQLLVLGFVDPQTKKRLLSEVTQERRRELYDAATSSSEKKD